MAASTDGPSAILAGVDGSPASLRAGAYAAGLARRQGAPLIVAFVGRVPSTTGYAPETLGLALDALEETSRDLQHQVTAAADLFGVETEFVTRRGRPCAELQRLAQDRRVDLIVVGAPAAPTIATSGRWPTGSFAPGSGR